MRTSAMAEGAIEGDAAVYEVPSAFATAFAFSRFDPAPEGPPIADDGLVWVTVESFGDQSRVPAGLYVITPEAVAAAE